MTPVALSCAGAPVGDEVPPISPAGAFLRVVCAWCGVAMGEKPTTTAPGISHGMCPECLVDWLAQVREYNRIKKSL